MKHNLDVTEDAPARADDDRRGFLGAALLGLTCLHVRRVALLGGDGDNQGVTSSRVNPVALF